MRSGTMVILKVAFQNVTQMLFANYNYMIETSAPDRADKPFHIWSLPGAVRGSDYFLNLHSSHTLAEFFAIDLIAIPQQKAWGSFFREYFHDLLSCPSSRRMFGHIEMRHTPVNR